MRLIRNASSDRWYRAWILLAGFGLFALAQLLGIPRPEFLHAQTTSAPSQGIDAEVVIPRLFEEFPRSLSSEERARVAEALPRAQEIALNHANDWTCPLKITRASARSAEILRETGETPLNVVHLSFQLANNTSRRISGINCGLYRSGLVKEVPLRLFRSIQPYSSREFSTPSSISSLSLRYLPLILKAKPEALVLKIDGVAFEDGTGWGDVADLVSILWPSPSTAPLGASQADTGQPPTRIRVGKNLQEAHLLRRVPPIYPPLAKESGIEGTVVLEVTIDRGGGVAGLQITSGHPQLVDAALAAVSQWRYRVPLLNNQPVEVVSSVEVTFKLTAEK
jgi:TonB family protein